MTNKEAIQWFIKSPFYHNGHEPFKAAIRALEREDKKGHWIECGEWSRGSGMGQSYGSFFICSECNKKIKSESYKECTFNFCPYCGADMRGNKNGKDSD